MQPACRACLDVRGEVAPLERGDACRAAARLGCVRARVLRFRCGDADVAVANDAKSPDRGKSHLEKDVVASGHG
jgi:hypothetical protein